MEEEGCQFQKYGFCKFREGCKKKHFAEICDKLSRCTEIKQCQKRHPKNCKRFASGSGCRHDEQCAYHHHGNKYAEEMRKKVETLEKMVADLTNKEVSKENEKMEQLEVVVKALVRKVLSLESEIKVMKGYEEPVLLVMKESESEKVEEEKGDSEKEPETTKEASKAASSRKVIETANKVEDKNKVVKLKENKVFKFRAEARENVLDGKESEEREKIVNRFQM